MSGLLPSGCNTVNDALAWGIEYALEISDCKAYSVEADWLSRYKKGGARWEHHISFRELAQCLLNHLRKRERKQAAEAMFVAMKARGAWNGGFTRAQVFEAARETAGFLARLEYHIMPNREQLNRLREFWLALAAEE